MEFPEFPFVPIASCLVSGNPWEESGVVSITAPQQAFIHADEIPPELSLLQAELSQPSHPLLIRKILQLLNQLPGLSQHVIPYDFVSAALGSPELDPAWQMCLTRSEQ